MEIVFKLYSVQGDGSKIYLGDYAALADAQAAMTDGALTYSIEQWDGCFATILI